MKWIIIIAISLICFMFGRIRGMEYAVQERQAEALESLAKLFNSWDM